LAGDEGGAVAVAVIQDLEAAPAGGQGAELHPEEGSSSDRPEGLDESGDRRASPGGTSRRRKPVNPLTSQN
jgi:hypothetical protein